MTIAHPVSVEAQGLYKFFNPGQPTKAKYDGQTLRVFGDGMRSFANQQIDKVDLDLRWLHHALDRDPPKRAQPSNCPDSRNRMSKNCTRQYPRV